MPAEPKRLYQKPVLERVVLVPAENVLAACHDIATGSGAYSSPVCVGVCYFSTLDINKTAP